MLRVRFAIGIRPSDRMRVARRRSCAWALLFGASAAACSPSSQLPETSTFASSTGATSSGVGGGGFGGAPPSCQDPKDTDGDNIADVLELAPSQDTDKDGKPDYEDDDSDGDGVPDAVEAVNPKLPPGTPGQTRNGPCDPLADTDNDGTPDVRDLDSDNDGVPDAQESAYDPTGSLGCRVLPDCDGDGVIDLVELAAGTNPADPSSVPADPGLYFVLPYHSGDKTKDFDFSTGVARADIYFLLDTTQSMQPTIDALKASLSSVVLPAILNGDLSATPPIPPISDAWIGVGDFRDVPWGGYGQPGDAIYRKSYVVNGQTFDGSVAPPVPNGTGFDPPASVTSILGSLQAAGGGDAPEATTQALWIASTNAPYAATIGDIWSPAPPYPVTCPDPTMRGVPCFRDKSLPVFVVVTDAPFHNGPNLAYNYDPIIVGGVKTYADAVGAITALGAKVVGVPVNTGTAGAARADLEDLATKTGSLWHDPAFGGQDVPLVPKQDVATGSVPTEVVTLLGNLVGAGLHDVTTARQNYDCAGNVDCNGDGVVDPTYHNPVIAPDTGPYDASKLITAVNPVPSTTTPLPYVSLDATTFFGVHGAAKLTFRVHADNETLKPSSLLVLRALIRVVTPTGDLLGGPTGIKLVYFVIPPYVEQPK